METKIEELRPLYDKKKLGLETVENARQLGGYIGAGGKKIKMNRLLRTAALDKISAEEMELLKEKYNLRHVFDFRMELEYYNFPDKKIDGVEYHWINVMGSPFAKKEKAKYANISKGEMYIKYAESGRLANLYVDLLLNENAQEGYKLFFDTLIKTDGAVLWHCTQGKDRAGTAAALLLTVLGVDPEVILTDYELTNVAYEKDIENIPTFFAEFGIENVDVDIVFPLFGVDRELLKKGFIEVKRKYGSIQKYYEENLGFTEEKVKKLREMYLE